METTLIVAACVLGFMIAVSCVIGAYVLGRYVGNRIRIYAAP